MRFAFRAMPVIAILVVMAAGPALAGGGPQNVLVIANRQSADSLAVANAYRAARGIPQRNLLLVDVPAAAFASQSLLPREKYDTLIVTPLAEFVRRHPAGDRLQFIVLCPDLPLRSDLGDPTKARSLAALLTVAGTDVVGLSTRNPYCGQRVAFERRGMAGEYADRMKLVTWLRGYERSDAMDLIRRSLSADGTAPRGTFYMVDSPHTSGFDRTVDLLKDRGIGAEQLPLKKALADATDVMAYLSGGDYSGLKWDDITSNRYRPGALADMLESYGACWFNWPAFGYHLQVPVAWMIRAGATGVHGTTDEPLAAAFPSAGLSDVMLANYLNGCNLAEAYWSAIRNLGWQNAVFGDPLCAPYAVRTELTMTGTPPAQGSQVRRLTVAFDAAATAPAEVRFFVDGAYATTIVPADAPSTDPARPRKAATFELDGAKLPDGWHRVRAVGVEPSVAAVQSQATTDVETSAHGRSVTLAVVARPGSPSRMAAGDLVTLEARYAGEPAGAKVALVCGGRMLGEFENGKVEIDTTDLGVGMSEIHAEARDAMGGVLARSRPIELTLVEPLHVVEWLPDGPTGTRPTILLRYNEVLAFDAETVSRSVTLVQQSRVAARATASGRNLVIEPREPLVAGRPCRIQVSLPQGAQRSRDVDLTITPTNDAHLLYTLPREAAGRMSVTGLAAQWGQKRIEPIRQRPAMVALGPVDVFAPKRPARWAMPAYAVSAVLVIEEKARAKGQSGAGAGLGVLYSDADNYCRVRIEEKDVVVMQVREGKTTRLKSWPAPGEATTGRIPMTLEIRGPQLAVTVGGKRLGDVMLDVALPPGVPMIDLGASAGIAVEDVRVLRP